MHILVVFGLLMNILTRTIGAIVAFDMYSKTRDTRHLLQLSGWILLAISATFPYATMITEDLFLINFFLISNLVFLNLGLYLLITGLYMYFALYKKDFLLIIILFIFFVPYAIFLFIDYSLAVNTTVLIQILVLIIFISVFYSNRNEIKEFLQYSFGLITLLMIFLCGYVIILILLRLNGYDYGLYMSNDLIAIGANYSSIALLTMLGIIVFLHLEQGIFHKQHNTLKDDYSHKIGNILQVIMGAGSIVKENSLSKEDSNIKAELILSKANEAGELIKEIRKM